MEEGIGVQSLTKWCFFGANFDRFLLTKVASHIITSSCSCADRSIVIDQSNRSLWSDDGDGMLFLAMQVTQKVHVHVLME